MNSKILVHENLGQRIDKITELLALEKLKQSHPDVLWIDDEKLGVEQVKKVRQFLSLKPYSAKGRTIIILNAHNLTLDAQNSLLKTLEEPPENSVILLGAETDKSFLPTVLSRCEIVFIESSVIRHQPLDKISSDIEKIIGFSIGERFEFVEKLDDKEQFLNELIVYFRNKLLSKPSTQNNNFAKDLILAEEWKSANGNLRAILEYLMLMLP